ncbi:hypothetical protein [Guptibacillus hwajinpoensis]|uniref:hypothetical protein n=1 Tax=Guptibacillus hwajinpoensis TaxID=208199 RepID=UPI00373606FE
MEDKREFRSFIVLENLSFPSEPMEISVPKEPLDYKGEKVIIKQYHEKELGNFLDYEFLWETKREITSEILDEETGEIFYEIDYIKKVAQISVWIYKDFPFWIVFTKGITPNKVMNLINDYFPSFQLSRLYFKDEFFNLLLNIRSINVLQTTMKSASTEQEFSISGYLNKSNYSLTDGYITELQIEIPSVYIRAKLSNSGRVALYNTPDKHRVNEFIRLIGEFLIESDTMRRDYR